VPVGDLARVERDLMDELASLDLTPELARFWKPVLRSPRPTELDARRLRRRALHVNRPRPLVSHHGRTRHERRFLRRALIARTRRPTPRPEWIGSTAPAPHPRSSSTPSRRGREARGGSRPCLPRGPARRARTTQASSVVAPPR